MNPRQAAALLAGDRRHRVSSGPGVRLHRTAFGTGVRFHGGPADFSHPWLAEMAGANAAVFLPGTVNRVRATIKGVPLAGLDGKAPPQLEWDTLALNADGIGWFCAEVTCDPAHDFAVTACEIVQVADPDTDDGKPGRRLNATGGAFALSKNRARWPLAMLQRRANGLVEVFQVTFFDLTHRVKLAANGRRAARHFFW